MRMHRTVPALAVVSVTLVACVGLVPPAEEARNAEGEYLERLREAHPELEYGANGYPLLSEERQLAMSESYLQLMLDRRVPGLRGATAPRDWIATAYHGEVLDANHEPVELDEETLGLIQESLLELLWRTADPAVVDELGLSPEAVGSIDAQGAVLLAARGGILRALVEASPPDVRQQYGWRQRLVQEAVFMLPLWSQLELLTLEDLLVPSPLHEILPRFRVPYIYYLPSTGLPTYNDLCAAQGVPEPPDWPDSRWVAEGKLSLQFGGGKIFIFSYAQPGKPGACIALQRWLPNPKKNNVVDIAALGVICQSAVTGRACFWDNLRHNPRTGSIEQIRGQTIRMEMDKVRNGSNLASPCTQCHKGENVFLIHPGTPLQVTNKTATKLRTDPGKSGWYTPMGQRDWKNGGPLKLPAVTNGSCTDCHQLPEPSKSYCDRVLAFAATMTMAPPGGKKSAGWPAPTTSKWHTHTKALVDACKGVG